MKGNNRSYNTLSHCLTKIKEKDSSCINLGIEYSFPPHPTPSGAPWKRKKTYESRSCCDLANNYFVIKSTQAQNKCNKFFF